MDSEFAIIDSLFRRTALHHPDTTLGIGDDASIHRLGENREIVVSTDVSVAGVHWPDDVPLDVAADRAVCAALSDLAAMGAEAAWAWIGVQATDAAAISAMAKGIDAAMRRFRVELAGGDTARSPVNALNVCVSGSLPRGSAMRRDGARDRDEVWLCGRTGFAAMGLRQWQKGGRAGEFVDAFLHVHPRLDVGVRLRQIGLRCCIDVSDGLLQDAGHIAHASGLCLQLDSSALPGVPALAEASGPEKALDDALHGGEDYALLCTAPVTLNAKLVPLAQRIGSCTASESAGVWLDGQPVTSFKGYDHFASAG